MVDEYVAYTTEKSEVDCSCYILLVVLHQIEQFVIVITRKIEFAIMLADVSDGLMQLVSGESSLFFFFL